MDETAEVTAFANDLAGKLSAGQLDSLKAAYPALAGAGAIVPLKGDSVTVVAASTPGQYDVTLAPGVTMSITRAADGSMTVNETRGLFSFPADRKEIAKKTGMWDDSLNDAQMAERMNDDAFFKKMNKQSSANTKNLISVGKMVITKEWPGIEVEPGYGYFPLTNNSDIAIKGSDYNVVIKASNVYSGESWTYTESGIDLAPKGSGRINVEFVPRCNPEKASIKFKVSEKDLMSRTAPAFTGNEYQEYLNSKK